MFQIGTERAGVVTMMGVVAKGAGSTNIVHDAN